MYTNRTGLEETVLLESTVIQHDISEFAYQHRGTQIRQPRLIIFCVILLFVLLCHRIIAILFLFVLCYWCILVINK